MAIGSGLARLEGYPFEVRYSRGSLSRARANAQLAADAYDYLNQLFSQLNPRIALVIADRRDWESRQPYGLPFFNDAEGQISPGIVVMPATRGDFWAAMGADLRESSPQSYPTLLATYPDGAGGLDLQPFFDLVTIHELGHAFEVLGGLELPTFWLSEIFANLALHSFIATRRPQSLATLETLSIVGAASERLDERVRTQGFTTLEQLQDHYTGGERPMEPLNYVWYQYRWQRLAARMFDSDGEEALRRLWDVFHARGHLVTPLPTAASLAPLLGAEVSPVLAEAIRDWR